MREDGNDDGASVKVGTAASQIDDDRKSVVSKGSVSQS